MFFGFIKIDFTKIYFNLKIENNDIKNVTFTKFLGVLIDCKLTWNQHISHISSQISRALYMLSRLRNKLCFSSLNKIYYALIYPHLMYCNILWGNGYKSVIHNLFLLQKRAVRIMCNVNYRHHTVSLFMKAKILKLNDLCIYGIGLFVYKCVNDFLPNIRNSFLIRNPKTAMAYELRIKKEFIITKFRTKLRERFIIINGPRIWQTIPEEISEVTKLSNFKNHLKSFLLQRYHLVLQ